MPSGEKTRMEEPTDLLSRIRRFFPFLILLAFGIALAGIMITFLLPSQVLKPESLRAQALVQSRYQEMIDAALQEAPAETTAYREREECWKEGKRLCIYGWYAEWVSGGYLLSYTLATEEEDRHGHLRGWWWEVDPQKETVRPIWQTPALQKKYRLRETDDFLRLAAGAKERDRPPRPPLIKIP